jgi:HSP20 family protein
MRVAFVRHDPLRSMLTDVLRSAGARAAGVPTHIEGDAAAIPARVDVVDKGDRFGIKVDLPGVSKEDINIAVEGANVSVSAAARATAEPESAPKQIVLRAERAAPKYARTLQLPAEVDGNAAEASFENGVLTLNLPKRIQAAQITVR